MPKKTIHPVIQLENIHLTLGEGASKVHVLRGISLNVETGKSVGVVGPSGSGKSTLLMVMAGLERVDSGTVTIGGQDFSKMSEDQIAAFRGRNIGIVFQSFHLIPNMTALENVAVPLELAGRDNAFEKATSRIACCGFGGKVELITLLKCPAVSSKGLLSQGLWRRTLKFWSRMNPPAIWMRKRVRKLRNLLFEKQRERGTTLVLVTHDPVISSAQCDVTLRVRAGEIEES